MRFQFNELSDLLGQRIDHESVLDLAQRLGAKPPKPSTDSNDTGYLTHKASKLEVAWSHRVCLPDLYPPRKQGRLYVCYVTTIWFDPAMVDGLPEGLSPGADADAIVRTFGAEKHTSFVGTTLDIPLNATGARSLSVDLDDAGQRIDEGRRWIMRLDEHNCYAYPRSVSHAFPPWRPEWPLEQADLATGFFLAWCIERGHIGERHLREHAELVEAVRARRMTGREFFYRTAYEGEFWSWDVSKALQRFCHTYFCCLCHRNSTHPLLGRADRCGPDDDLIALFGPHFPHGGGETADDWRNYDRFALLLDARYEDWKLTDLESDIDTDMKRHVKLIYLRQQKQMAELPPPVAADFGAKAANISELPADFSQTLLDWLETPASDPAFLAWLSELGLAVPDVPGYCSIDAPDRGFLIKLRAPWNVSRLEARYNADDRQKLQRKRLRIVEEIEFGREGYSTISNTNSLELAFNGYRPKLPFGLAFSDRLAEVDAHFGEDALHEHTWETYDDEETLTRRWDIGLDGRLWPDDPTTPTYRLILKFERSELSCVRVVLR